LPSAPSSDRSTETPADRIRGSRKQTWPTPGTLVFTGGTLEAAVAAAAAELGPDVDVRAARSVKQGLRGKTHVEVLVTEPAGSAWAQPEPSRSDARPPLPPSELPPSPRGQGTRRASDADPVESTLAALLASAEAEEQEFERSTNDGSASNGASNGAATVLPFEAPQLAGNPTFAAEFAAAFPAALAAARAAEEGDRTPFEGSELAKARLERVREAVADDFTARVRDALQRVPQEDEPEAADDATEELPVTRADALPGHPALELIDEPPTVVTKPTPAPAGQGPSVVKSSRLEPQPTARPAAGAENGRRSRPSPGPSAAAARPAALRRPSGSGWSGTRLRDLGVPDAVLAALPAEEPADDLRWVVALTDAIAATVPAPAEDGTAHVTANGTGLRGALALLRLGVDGVPPQTLSVDGRAVPATATELALAIRAGILR
jgi:hypothetical protein